MASDERRSMQQFQAFDGPGVTFRLVMDAEPHSARQILLTWQHEEGKQGQRHCRSYLEAIEYASRVVASRSLGIRLTS
jgi:hypothetical protein